MKVLVIKPSSLGDIFHTLPAVRVIKKHLPDCHISWLISDQFTQLASSFADVDEFIIFKRRDWARVNNWFDLLKFLSTLRKRYFDYVFDFQGLFRSGICSFLVKSGRKIGFADAREFATFFYKQKITVPIEFVHAVEKNISLVNQAFGLTHDPHDYSPPRFKSNENARIEASQLLSPLNLTSHTKLIAIAPAARWDSKTWPSTFFAEIINLINQSIEESVHFWLLGAEDERDIGESILQSTFAQNVTSLMGKTRLPVMLELLRMSNVLLSNDSGPMHIAAALQLPVVSLFGPTDPAKTGPFGNRHHVFRTQVTCSPCFKRKCPLPRQLCLDDVITPQEVSRCILETIQETKVNSDQCSVIRKSAVTKNQD